LIWGSVRVFAYGLPLITLSELGSLETFLGTDGNLTIWAMGSLQLAIALGMPFAVFISRYRFKKRTGHTMTLKNLYNSETGRKLT